MIYGIYHKDCQDGVVSAVILKKVFPNILLYPSSFDHTWKRLPLNEGDKIFFVDICPIPQDIIWLEENKVEWTIIDHHITPFNKIENYKKEHPECKFENYFYYPNNCGSYATWDHFFKNEKIPELIKFIDIIDLWKWDEDKNSREINQYLFTFCKRGNLQDHEKMLENFDYKEASEKGRILLLKMENDVDYAVGQATLLNFDGERVLSLNGSIYSSEIGNALALKSGNGIGIVYEIYPKEDLVRVRVRGTKGNIARLFAEKYGGGGHDKAASFTLTIKEFFEVLNKK